MAQREYVYCETYGLVYRFTRRNWMRVLKELAAGREVNYDHYGTAMFTVNHNITDLDQEQAQGLLADYTEEVAR